ncbi:MAG: flagellar protein FlaF [Alphaproteobacteria bacterium]|nr:flagellar protein FlaF [Alphaproteobacteria bacterium]
MESETRPMGSQASVAISGYQQTQKTVDTNREATPAEVDAIVLRQAAERLLKAQQMPDDEFFEESLLYNQLIWTVIQSEMTAENPLSEEIKANLISLSIFVDKQTAKAIGTREPDLLNTLININRNISMGLERTVPEQPVGEQPEL